MDCLQLDVSRIASIFCSDTLDATTGAAEMTDRELLELAAKAAGIEVVTPTMLEHKQWNPLEDDGDALRLAVKLEITIQFPWDDIQRPIPEVHCWTDAEEPIIERLLDDKCAATRRAITRAAAEMANLEMLEKIT